MPNKTKNRRRPAASSTAVVQRPRKQTQPRKATIPRLIRPNPSAIHEVCGMTDAFCSHARGAKVPDDSNTNSLTWTFRGLETLTSNSVGSRALLWLPGYNNLPFVECTMSGNTASLPGTSTVNVAALPDIQQFRIVSAGFRIKNIAAPLSSSGMVHIRCGDQLKAASFSPTYLPLNYSSTQSLDIPLQDCHDVYIMAPRTAQPRANFYLPGTISPGLAPADWTAPGYAPVTIAVTGVPISTDVIQVEYIINYEIQFDFGIGMGAIATPPPAYSPGVTAAANLVSSTSQSIFANGLNQFSKYVERKAATALASYLGGPLAGAAVARLVD